MKVEFKKPIIIEGVKYERGVQDFPDSLSDHWYLKALCQNGKAFIRSVPKAAKVEKKKVEEKVETASQEEAQEMIDKGEAEIPQEAIVEKPKKKKGKKKKGE